MARTPSSWFFTTTYCSLSDVQLKKFTMECPVCHRQGIDSLLQKCPECGADLTPLGRIQKLRQRVKRNYIMLLSLIVVLVIAILIGIFQYHSSTSLAETKSLSDSVTLLIQVNQKLSDSLNIL